MVLGKLPVPGRPTIWITVGQGPTALAVGAGGGCLDIFTLSYPFSRLSSSLWETARYRLKYCLKGPLNPKQPTNQPLNKSLLFISKSLNLSILPAVTRTNALKMPEVVPISSKNKMTKSNPLGGCLLFLKSLNMP